MIGKDEVMPDPEKTKAIVEWPSPGSSKDIQRFLGLCSYYRKFIPDFATVAKPLHDLANPAVHFNWSA